MANTGRKLGWIGWTLIILALLAATLFGLWRWAINAQSVALLDRVDAIFTSGDADVTPPISFGPEPEQAVLVGTPSAPSTKPRPVVVFIHGGSWSHGNAPDYAYITRNLAAENFVSVTAGYRLVPGGEFPAMLEDAAAAIRWTVENIAEHGGDPSRIYVMGHSAGAYNAVMVALDPQWLAAEGLPADTIKGAIGLAGPYDFLPLDSEGTINAFGGAEDLSSTQPINFVRKDAPPLLLLTGDADTTVRPRNSIALAKAMADAGAPTQVQQFPGMSHAGIIMALAKPFAGDGNVKTAIFDFLEQVEANSSGDIQPPQG